MSPLDLAAVVELARRQHGVFSTGQAVAAGVLPRTLGLAVARGLLERVHPDVLRFAGAAADRPSLLWAAVLHVGDHGRLSHESALHLHGVDRVPFDVAVTIPSRAHHRSPGIRVHRLCDLVDGHRAQVGGLPTTTLERAVVDVSAVISRAHLSHLVDQVTVTRRSTSVGRIGRVLRQVNRRGRRNIANLADVLAERSPHEPAPRSTLERQFDALVARSGLPTPRREHPLHGASGLVGLVDRYWPETGLVAEIDGRAWHAREASMARDRARDRAAAAAGLVVLRFLDEEVAACPELVVADLLAAWATRAASRPPNANLVRPAADSG